MNTQFHNRLVNYETFNEAYLSFFQNSFIKNLLVPVTDTTGYFLAHQYDPTLRIYNQNPDSVVVTPENLVEGAELLQSKSISSDSFIYPYSRHTLLNHLLSIYDPAFSHALYTSFIDHNLIINYGSGKGFATIVTIPTESLDSQYHLNLVSNYSYSSFSKAIDSLFINRLTPDLKKLEYYYDILHSQIIYYEATIQSLIKEISNNEQVISDLKKQMYINTQLTWR